MIHNCLEADICWIIICFFYSSKVNIINPGTTRTTDLRRQTSTLTGWKHRCSFPALQTSLLSQHFGWKPEWLFWKAWAKQEESGHIPHCFMPLWLPAIITPTNELRKCLGSGLQRVRPSWTKKWEASGEIWKGLLKIAWTLNETKIHKTLEKTYFYKIPFQWKVTFPSPISISKKTPVNSAKFCTELTLTCTFSITYTGMNPSLDAQHRDGEQSLQPSKKLLTQSLNN